jgi:hypothetical protein
MTRDVGLRERRVAHRVVSFLSLGIVPGLSALACSSSAAVPDDTCAFAADTNNCYRKLLAAVDDCLTDARSDGGPAMGTLSADGISCTYASGRTVTFVGDVRRYGSSKNPIEVMDVTVAIGGKTCVHYIDTSNTLTVTEPDGGVLKVVAGGAGEIITCPDGSQHGIDAQKVPGICVDAAAILSGMLPGAVRGGGGGTGSVTGGLIGLTPDAYSCTSP